MQSAILLYEWCTIYSYCKEKIKRYLFARGSTIRESKIRRDSLTFIFRAILYLIALFN